jgi:hypothetical protein
MSPKIDFTTKDLRVQESTIEQKVAKGAKECALGRALSNSFFATFATFC